MNKLITATALAVGLGLAGVAHADGVKVGTLTCDEEGGWGMILGSNRAVHCTFEEGDRSERYDGSITKIGVDVGYKAAGVIIWAVIAPSKDVGPGALAGNYGGATAIPTAGVGVGAHALIGGNGNSITLQPLAIEGNEGLNVAAGIAGLNLKPHA